MVTVAALLKSCEARKTSSASTLMLTKSSTKVNPPTQRLMSDLRCSIAADILFVAFG
jgi:hypothetical protein